jgi:hypothetical protein
MNSNISALQDIVTALQGNDYVTSVAEIVEDGKVVGYTITFSKSGVVKIYHGKDGADGENGVPGADGRPGIDGTDGENGSDGVDGHTPLVGVKKDADGVYYWTIDGEWMLDGDGQKVPATGEDGEDAEEGAGGKDGVTPLLKIEDEYWFVSYDGGVNWSKLYKAVGENGSDGADGAPGAPGQDGKDGQSFFQGVDTTSSEDYIILILADGTQIKLPTWKAFEELQTIVNKLNTNVSALQAIVEALENNDYVTEINPIIDNGKEIGYTILFAKSQSITIYHGKDGADGSDGAPGQNGEDGKDGKDGYTPVLGVKASDEDWSLDNDWDEDSEGQTRYYWTLDGEWLLDSNGNRIPADGLNGNNGADGSAGKNGTNPKLKIEEGYWYISLDGGQTWQPEPLGPATAGAGGSIFSDITYTTSYLYLTLADGKVITLSRENNEISDYCVIDEFLIEGRNAVFTGHINVEERDIQYCKVSIYYSEAEDFNIHTAKVVSTTLFDYNNSFTLSCSGLEYDATYKYCICLDIKSRVLYSPIYKFISEAGGERLFSLEEIKSSLMVYNADNNNGEAAGTYSTPTTTIETDGVAISYRMNQTGNLCIFCDEPLYPGSEIEFTLFDGKTSNSNFAIGFDSNVYGEWEEKMWNDGGIIIPESHIWSAMLTQSKEKVSYLERHTKQFRALSPALTTEVLFGSDYRVTLKVLEKGFDIYKDGVKIYTMDPTNSNPYITHTTSPVYFCFTTKTAVKIKIHSIKQIIG